MTTPTTPLDLDAGDVLALIERAHLMSSAHPDRRETLYAKAADEITRLRVDLETKSVVHQCCVDAQDLTAERDAAIARAEAMEERYPCDGLCVEYPEEDCSRHGRAPAEIWEIVAGVQRQRDEALAKVMAGLALADEPVRFTRDRSIAQREYVLAADLRAALTEVHAGAGASGTAGAVVVSVPSEDAMLDLLMGLNASGITPELPCVWVKDIGTPGNPNVCVAPFLATLTEPDAGHVNYIVSDESGRSRCLMDCDNCGSEGETDWQPPSYPVQVQVALWPDEERCRADEINAWWVQA